MNRLLRPGEMASSLAKVLVQLLSIAILLFLCVPASRAAAQTSGGVEAHAPTEILPSPGIYKIDPRHSFAFFSAWHHLVGRVRGRFDQVTGTVVVSRDLSKCAVDVTIDVLSISSQVSRRDDDLRSDAYFDVKAFPTMTYQGRGIRRVSSDLWRMDGSLTIHGVARIVPLTFKYNGAFAKADPKTPTRVAFHATAATKRAEYGIGARDNKTEVGDSTAPDVDIEIDIEADATSTNPD